MPAYSAKGKKFPGLNSSECLQVILSNPWPDVMDHRFRIGTVQRVYVEQAPVSDTSTDNVPGVSVSRLVQERDLEIAIDGERVDEDAGLDVHPRG